MADVSAYPEIVQCVVEKYASIRPSVGEIEVSTICDRDAGRFAIVSVGWSGHRRIHGMILHIDIRDGKVWIQHDGTYAGVAEELVAGGIPREDIVLAWIPEYRRKDTDYAVA